MINFFNAVKPTMCMSMLSLKPKTLCRSKAQLERAMNWETAYVKFMKEWTSDPENTKYMDIAFNSERSIEVFGHSQITSLRVSYTVFFDRIKKPYYESLLSYIIIMLSSF